MPLVVMCGIPKSGKTTKALKIKECFEQQHKKNATIISEMEEINKAGFKKDTFYLDSQKEKHIRGVLKSEVMRLLDKDDVIILDSGNYIKGFRYELYCASKASKTTQCTVFCIANITVAEKNNNGATAYPPEVFHALVTRFEEPNSNSRWDQPLVMWGAEEEETKRALVDVYSALFQRAPPPPNLSTQNAPLSATTFLQRVDGMTREVCDRASHGLVKGLPSSPPPTPAQLARLRRQFLTYTKQMLSGADPDTISPLFVQYLVTNLH